MQMIYLGNNIRKSVAYHSGEIRYYIELVSETSEERAELANIATKIVGYQLSSEADFVSQRQSTASSLLLVVSVAQFLLFRDRISNYSDYFPAKYLSDIAGFAF